MLFKVSQRSAHQTANTLFGTGSLLSPSGLAKAAFCRFFGASISHVVLPAQKLSTDENFLQDTVTQELYFAAKVASNKLLEQELHTLECFDGASLETMELSHQEQRDKPKSEQQYVIYLCGNGMCMQDLYEEIYKLSLSTKRNFVAFNLKNVIRSHGTIHHELDLINDVISQIERLRDQGVDPKNICLVGHSLGAAFATLTSYIYFKEGTPIKIFNGRSFSNFATLAYLHEKNSGSSELKAQFKKNLLLFSNFEIEVAKYYDLLPDEYKDYITIEELPIAGDKKSVPDGIIPPEVSLRHNVQDQASTHLVRSTNTLFGMGHNDPLYTLECHEDGQTADERCCAFILK